MRFCSWLNGTAFVLVDLFEGVFVTFGRKLELKTKRGCKNLVMTI